MKSIMQEASSLVKAIEQGWQKAGKPQEFSVKIFQEGSKNFLGMTIQPAKIAIFFDNAEKLPVKKETRQAPKPEQKVQKKPERQESPRAHQQQPQAQPQSPRTLTPAAEKPVLNEPRVFWTEDMVTHANEWLKTMLNTMNLTTIPYSSTTINNQLRIVFNKPLHADAEKERQLYRSFSLLMLQALRHKLQRPLRGFKVVLITENA